MTEIQIFKLISLVKKRHLCFITFSHERVIIKQKLGNNSGSEIIIEFDNNFRIEKMDFIKGEYNEPLTLKKEYEELFTLIHNSSLAK